MSKARQTLPYSYQDQQQQQFPAYPTMMPQQLHDPLSNSTRTVPNYFTSPANGSQNAPIRRDNSYRLRTQSSHSSIDDALKRSNSRGGSAALQAGVPSRDNSHSERTYGRGQFTPGNGPVPPRRASRGMGGGHIGGSASNGTPPLSSTPLSNSPYGADAGTLSSTEEWKDRGAAVKTQQDYDINGKPVTRYIKKGVKDFSFGRTLGEGSYSTVLLAQDRQTHKEYAIKILDKRHIIKEKKVKYVNIEKNTLNRLTDHPGIVRLYYTFQDERSLYFVLDLASGGELLSHLKRVSTFSEECTRFYSAQILDTIDYMHRCGIIHRDLKPENVLLDDQMHVKITDFGTAKILSEKKQDSIGLPLDGSEESDSDRAQSFVGTAEYVSPELLTEKNACKASDLWAFGCIVYQLLAGRPPFKASNEYQTFQKIVGLDYEFPRGFPEVARDLVERLLVLDPSQRLSIEHIKNHQFFDGITWGRILWQQKAPRLKPYVPPAAAPIKLDGPDNYPPSINPSHTPKATHMPPATKPTPGRPTPRVITELPPPSQLDIEWSPVLTRNNERILKLGNLLVTSSALPHSPHNGEGGKLSRLFGGGASKKRQRLVMVTSSARIIMAPPGGEDKRMKSEISLLSPGTICSSATDAKGVTHWVVDTPKSHFVFEDPKPASGDIMATAVSTQEWLDTIDRAKEVAISQSSNNSYSNDSLNYSPSAFSSHANTLDRSMDIEGNPNPGSQANTTRNTLVKNPSSNDAESIKARKRFSKRQSKSGLAAVF